jgi:threonine dehydratase
MHPVGRIGTGCARSCPTHPSGGSPGPGPGRQPSGTGRLARERAGPRGTRPLRLGVYVIDRAARPPYTAPVDQDPTTASIRDVPLREIEAAAARIAGRVAHTPLLHSRTAARQLAERHGIHVGGAATGDRLRGQLAPGATEPRIYLKAEHLQVTGSFKSRGAVNRVLTMSPDERARGIVTMSAGNHAGAVAYAAAAAGIPVTVVMPEGASRAKAEAARAYGATVELYGEHVGETFQRLEQLRAEHGSVFIPPFDDHDVIAGQGTAGLEILADLPQVDVVVAGVGGGGLLSGVAAAIRQAKPSVRIYGVEPRGSDALTQGLAAGHPVTIRPQSIADGLGAPFAGVWTIDLCRRYVDAVVLVDDADIARGMRFCLERMKQLVEPAGAAALGAVLAGAVPIAEGDVVCVIASGGNVDLDRLPTLLGSNLQS